MAQSTDFYGKKIKGAANLNEWLSDNSRTKGCTSLNVHYLRAFKQVDKELGRTAVVNYFLLTKLGVEDVRTMLRSSMKQRKFLRAVIIDIKQYRIEADMQKMFDKELRSLQRRVDHVFRIVIENLKLTEYYPFFRDVGFEQLVDFSTEYHGGGATDIDFLIPQIEEYNATHQQEIAEHLESIKVEKEARDAHRQRIKEQDKLEKELRKKARKAANAEVKEIKDNEKKHKSRQKRIDRSFEYLYR